MSREQLNNYVTTFNLPQQIAGLSSSPKPKSILKKPPAMSTQEPPPSGFRHVRVRFENVPSLSTESSKYTRGSRLLRCETCGDEYTEYWGCKCRNDRRVRERRTSASAEKAHSDAEQHAADVKRQRREWEKREQKAAEDQKTREEAGRRRRSERRTPMSENKSQRPKPRESGGDYTPSTYQAPRDLYAVLGVSPTATEAEIKKAAKKMRIETHPDKFNERNLAPAEVDAIHERAKLVGQAADVLCDPEARREYAARLAREKMQRAAAGRFAQAGHAASSQRNEKDAPRKGASQQARRGSAARTSHHDTEKADTAQRGDSSSKGSSKDGNPNLRQSSMPRASTWYNTAGPQGPHHYSQSRAATFNHEGTFATDGYPGFGGPIPFQTLQNNLKFHIFEEERVEMHQGYRYYVPDLKRKTGGRQGYRHVAVEIQVPQRR